jgi:hypothetical protein
MPRLGGIAAVTAIMLVLTGCSGSSEAKAEEPSAPPPAAATPSDSPSPSPSPSTSPSASVVPVAGSISITCTAEDDTTTVFTVVPGSKGGYDFQSVWQARPEDCKVSGVNGRATATVKPTTALQKTAYRQSGYDDSDISGLFAICTLIDPDGFYNEPDMVMSPIQVRLFAGVLTICPSHPFAGNWRKAIQRAGEQSADDSDSTSDVVRGVHPGAFCAPAGARGYTPSGTPMTCSRKAGDSRARWRRA